MTRRLRDWWWRLTHPTHNQAELDAAVRRHPAGRAR